MLVLTALAVVTHSGLASIFNPGAHGFTEALYAYTSQTNNNGSAFAGYGATDFSTLLGSVAIWLGRFVPLMPPWRSAVPWPLRRPSPPPPEPSVPTARRSRS